MKTSTALCVSALLSLCACDGAGVDSEVEGSASLSITATFSDYLPEATGCQTAYAESLWIDLESASGETSVLAQPCDDRAVLLENLSPGAWVLQVRTVQDPETHTGIWGTSPATSITLVDGENSQDVVVACQALCGE
ncbi:MAG: hypothetical protein ACI9VR_000590 [Cognaticolwellia sp.]|jgi:hypothetical protein